jgi:type VI secretion system protein ImpA
LKKFANEGDWQQVLDLAETATGMPCGRGWLDAQRYSARAAYELGYSQIASTIQSEVNALVRDYPDLASSTLLDDTPAANAETQAWLQEIAPALASAAQSEVYYSAPPEPVESANDSAPDANDLALQAAREGRPGEAIEILNREASAESSGRGRFQRRLQLAQLCMSMNHERIAHPILEQLAAEIDARGLEGWESPNMVAHPLALFFRCLDKLNTNPELKERVYDRICRLDPVQALSCSR